MPPDSTAGQATCRKPSRGFDAGRPDAACRRIILAYTQSDHGISLVTITSPSTLDLLPDMLVAIAIGLLIGGEREWSQRDRQSERVMAGIRTFGLLGLTGALAVLLNQFLHPFSWAIILAGVMILIVAGYVAETSASGDWGMTTEIAMLCTFLLGSLAVAGQPTLAAGLGVLVALLLSMKNLLHTQVHQLSEPELSATLKLLFISVVMLPLLPNETMGPLAVFNPYVTWWMVVLIAGLGFAAYIAVRIVGPGSGIMLTAALGGMISSTAMTVTLSRLSRSVNQPATLAAGLLLTSSIMFPRMLLEAAVVSPAVAKAIWMPIGLGMLCYLVGVGWLLLRARKQQTVSTGSVEQALKNPFELGPALRFTALLVGIMFLVEIARLSFGDAGVFVMAAISGAADVDAITLSLARLANGGLDQTVAANGILIAAISNSSLKLALAGFIGGRRLLMDCLPAAGSATAVMAATILL